MQALLHVWHGKYEVSALTATSDRECATHNACAGDEWETRTASGFHDRQCAAHSTECDYRTHYESKAPGAEHDRTCTAIDFNCPAGEVHVPAHTKTSNTVCHKCGPGTYKPEVVNLYACAPCSREIGRAHV